MDSAASHPVVLLVLGMHRSGTSAVTRLLNLLGAELGEPLLNAQGGVNDAGFWEHAGVVELNERILAMLDSCWFDHRPYPDGWWQETRFAELRDEARVLLHDNFHTATLATIKDPRLCRTLPFWRQVLDELSWPVKVLLVQRDASEVAASLTRRDGFPAATGLLLWLAYTLDAELHSRDLPRAFIAYADVLADWRAAVDRLGEQLQPDWPVPVASAVFRIDGEIRSDLRHQRSERLAASRDWPDVGSLRSLLDENPDTAAIDRLRVSLLERFRECGVVHAALYASNRVLSAGRQELMAMGERHSEALRIVRERDEQLADRNRRLEELGGLYAHAESVVKERDAQLVEQNRRLEELGELYRHAESVVRERDGQLADCNRRLEELGGLYAHAESVVRERDAQLSELREQHARMAAAVRERDARLARIHQHWSWRILRHLPPFRSG